MAVPSTMADLSVTADNNSPQGTEPPISTDNFHRAIQAILRHTNAKGADIASATTTDIGAATGEFVDITGTTTITGLGTIAAGIERTVRFTGALTLTHNATSLILPGGANITTAANDTAIFRSLGSGNWICVSYKGQNYTFFSDVTLTGATLKLAKGADVASATALPLISDGNYFDVTGTTTITSFASLGVGTVIRLHFDDALILTHNATDLILPTGANITTAAGDEAEFVEYASGDWRCTSYTRANGKPIASLITLPTAVTASGTAVDFTSIPSWVKKITVSFVDLSTNGTASVLVQIGDSGGIENTGYSGSTFDGSASFNFTTGFSDATAAAAIVRQGAYTLALVDPATNTWSAVWNLGLSNAAGVRFGAGTKSISATLDRVRVATSNGTDTFDSGKVNIQYE
jgi:hypothetical protein